MLKRTLTRSKKDSILREANYICMYCGDPSNEVDHIHPHSYSLNDKEENLASSCSICNRIAGSKVFDGFIEKQTYIREERKKERWAKAIKEYRSLCDAVGLPLYIVRTEEKPKKKEVKVIMKRKNQRKKPRPKIPATFKSRAELRPVKPARKVRRWHLEESNRALAPILDYSNVYSYKLLFLAKFKKEGTFRNAAKQYGLHPDVVRLIAEGHEPGDEIRVRLNIPVCYAGEGTTAGNRTPRRLLDWRI